MLKTAVPIPPLGKTSDEELIALVEAFQDFNHSTTVLNQAYRRLESAAEALAKELEDTNRQLQAKNQELDCVNHYLQDLLQSINSGVIATDLEGRITIFNRMAEDLTGYRFNQVKGQNYGDFFAGELGEKAPLMHTLISGSPVLGWERELPLKSGKTITVKCSSCWVSSTAGERIGVMETLEDISQVRALENRIQQQKTLAALGEMAAQVAHELRNPLAGIKGFAGLLAEDLPTEHSSQRMVQRIIEGVDSLDRIASNLLILTQDCQSELIRQPLEPIFDQAIALIEASTHNRFTVRRDFPADSCPARVDGEKLKGLLLNLLKNAAEAMDHTGEAIAGYRYNPLANEVRLFVCDQGPGVPEEVLDKIFNPFFTTRPRGTGLGLAIVKKIAELHRGRVEYSTPEGGGAIFTIYLPII